MAIDEWKREAAFNGQVLITLNFKYFRQFKYSKYS
jgi:hypothetical protein